MSVRSGGVRVRLAMLVAALLPAALIAAAPTPALAARTAAETECFSVRVDDPWIRTDGWRVYVLGNGIAYCDGYAGVRVQLKRHISNLPDKTVQTRDGREWEHLTPFRDCPGTEDFHTYYTEITVWVNGREWRKEQSGRTLLNAKC
jgi:hypothetical protein